MKSEDFKVTVMITQSKNLNGHNLCIRSWWLVFIPSGKSRKVETPCPTLLQSIHTVAVTSSLGMRTTVVMFTPETLTTTTCCNEIPQNQVFPRKQVLLEPWYLSLEEFRSSLFHVTDFWLTSNCQVLCIHPYIAKGESGTYLIFNLHVVRNQKCLLKKSILN